MADDAGNSEPRPTHIIRPHEIAEWLAESAYKAVTVHRTSRQAAREIVGGGVNIERSRLGSFGQGFYTSTEGDPFYGDTEIYVAIRTVHPLVGTYDHISELVDALVDQGRATSRRLTVDKARDVRTRLVREGYDAIIVWDGGGDGIDYVIALRGDVVKVVEP